MHILYVCAAEKARAAGVLLRVADEGLISERFPSGVVIFLICLLTDLLVLQFQRKITFPEN